MYASPALTGFPYSKGTDPKIYSPGTKVDATGLSIIVPLTSSLTSAHATRLVEIDFQNEDRNVQLLLPMTVTLGCTGGATCAKPVPAPTPPRPTPPPTMPRVAPIVYHLTAPTLFNETLMVAGAGLDTVTARLCQDAACANVVASAAPADTWQKSIKVVLPASCGPPCFLSLASPQYGVQTHTVNAPDIWWPTTGTPGVCGNSTSYLTTSRAFLSFFKKEKKLCTTPHPLHDRLYLVPVLIGCWLVVAVGGGGCREAVGWLVGLVGLVGLG